MTPKDFTFHAQRRSIQSCVFKSHVIHIDNTNKSSNTILSTFMHDQLLHDKEKPKLIRYRLSIRIQFPTSVHENVSSFFVITFEANKKALFHHALNSILIDIPVIKPFRTIGLYRVKKIQFLFGSLQTKFTASQKIHKKLVI